MNRNFLVALAFALASQAGAQDDALKSFENMVMRPIGPAAMSGRVTTIDVHPANPDVIYAGTASGGLWLSTNGGMKWKPLFDKQPVQSIGALKIDPLNPDIIWAGTGEGNPRNSHTSGNGIYKSLDAGRTWQQSGLQNTRTIHRIAVNTLNNREVYAGVTGSAWGPGPDRGVYKTEDGGTTWKKILFVNDSTGCADLVMDPTNPDKLFAAMWQYGRKPWTFKSGGGGSGLYRTVDGGKTWTEITDKHGLPAGELGRIGLAVSPSNPNVVYALVEAKTTGLYKSTDGGYQWSLVTEKGVDDRPFYYHEIYVDPTNENRLIYLHSTVSESIDGGKTFRSFIGWEIHPDHHAFWWSPADPTYMIEGNDGGLNISRDNGRTWQFVSGLPLGQFYHINYDMDTPYHVYGGMQDNGSWKGPAYTWNYGGIRSSDWQEILFGDGFDVVPYPRDNRYAYAMYQGGELSWVDGQTGETRKIKPIHPEGIPLRFHWNSAISADPFNPEGVYYGSQFVHYSADRGLNWKILSPDLTTNDSTKLRQFESGGLTIDNTSAENHCTLLSITPSALDRQVIWAGSDDGQVHITTDGGVTWKNCRNAMPGFPAGAWVPQIVASPHRASEAFVVVNNYRQDDWKPYLYHTTDFGKTWKNLVTPSAVNGYCLSVVQDPVVSALLFLGTEHGLYVSVDSGARWHHWKHHYPHGVATQDLKIHPREHDLIIGTFGRAAYILENIAPLRKFALEREVMQQNRIVAIAPAPATQASYKQPAGPRFGGATEYQASNKSPGAALTYWYNVGPEATTKETRARSKPSDEPPAGDKSADAPKSKKVKIIIQDMAGDTMRWFTHEPDTGINIVHWRFDTRGLRMPASKKPEPDADPPGDGPPVMPGKYKVVFVSGQDRDSTELTVNADPRLPFDKQVYEAQVGLYRRWEAEVKRVAKAYDQVLLMKTNIEHARTSWAHVSDSLKKTTVTASDTLLKALKELEKLFVAVEEPAGIHDDAHYLVSKCWTAIGYFSLSAMPGSNAENAVKQLEQATAEVVKKVNAFAVEQFEPWSREAERIPVQLFKPLEPID